MDIDKIVDMGVNLARIGSYSEALKTFDEDLCFTQNSTAMSYYALSLAHVEGNYDKAISFCVMAAEKEHYNPDIYLNLGKILLMNGQKSIAVKSFRKGLKYDKSNTEILTEMYKLGIRKRPIISFLGRQNFVNKLLGIAARRSLERMLSEKTHLQILAVSPIQGKIGETHI